MFGNIREQINVFKDTYNNKRGGSLSTVEVTQMTSHCRKESNTWRYLTIIYQECTNKKPLRIVVNYRNSMIINYRNSMRHMTYDGRNLRAPPRCPRHLWKRPSVAMVTAQLPYNFLGLVKLEKHCQFRWARLVRQKELELEAKPKFFIRRFPLQRMGLQPNITWFFQVSEWTWLQKNVDNYGRHFV